MKWFKQAVRTLFFLRCLPKTLYVNFKALPPAQAKKLPLYVGRRVTLQGLRRGSICIASKQITRGMIQIGMYGPRSALLCQQRRPYSVLQFGEGARLVFRGRGGLAVGVTVMLAPQARLVLGEDFSTNVSCNFFVYKKVEFGDDCFCGWNVSIRDGDGHFIIDNETGQPVNRPEAITIGSHCWLCSDVTVMKGVSVADHCVLACNSLVLKPCTEPHAIYGGSPAKLLKRNVSIVRDAHEYGAKIV